ncbi:MAG: FtsX-like permease family protein [Planctomycetes bacterium]|nr:FtsX-like permease family protein [Planctomycetota bacterium]
MYKILLCWRYLRTRFLAVVCIVSVMLGVATLVVVNSVMSGFSTKLKDRLHGLLSDVVVETPNYNGFPLTDEEMMRMIRQSPAGEHIEAMTPTIEVVAMANFEMAYRNDQDPGYSPIADRQKVTRPIRLVGVDPKGRAAIGGFAEFLTDPKRREQPSFDLSPVSRAMFERQNPLPPNFLLPVPEGWPANVPPPEETPAGTREPKGAIVGFAIASYRDTNTKTGKIEDMYVLQPGDTIDILTVGAGKREIQPVFSPFVVAGYIKTEMAEYDSNYVFVPLDYLQQIRGTPGRSTHIQIKLKDYAQSKFVVAELKKIFRDTYTYQIFTWEEKQGALLAAIDIERGILNLLLFMIIGVAGFSILAIFSMIVVEKTRDIGILKSLGASNRGVMMIFLGYGLLLGVVGSGLGTLLGLLITDNINVIEAWLSMITGKEIFDRKVYYFDEIPTDVRPWNVIWLNIGAISIAASFSVIPALRAALLKPVQALRFE